MSTKAALETLDRMEHWLDESRYPIILQVFPERYTDAELVAAFDHLDAVVDRVASGVARASLISDVTRSRTGNALQRQRISRTFVRTQRRLRDRVVGQAFVIRSPIQRGGLTALLWLYSPSWPMRVFGTRAEAFEWLEACHRAHPG